MSGAPQFRPNQPTGVKARWRGLAWLGLKYSKTFSRPKSLKEVEDFSATYRRAATELARVRSFSPDAKMAEYIEQAVGVSHYGVYRKERTPLSVILRGLIFAFPNAIRTLWKYHALSLVLTLGAAALAYTAVMLSPDTFYYFIARDLAGGRDPTASREFLASTLQPQPTNALEDFAFSQMLFTHNTKVAFLCFAWGFVLGIPTMYLLIKNGLMLGAFVALFVRADLSVEVMAWLLPHGIPEIGAIILCGGAGMALGHRLLNPGRMSRKDALKFTGGHAAVVAMGCTLLLFMAGIIEGGFRQSYASIFTRYLVAFTVGAVLLAWFLGASFTEAKRPKTLTPIPD